MADLTDQFAEIASLEEAGIVAAVAAGLLASVIVKYGIERVYDAPDPVYGIIVTALAIVYGYLGGPHARYVAAGGVVHTGIETADAVDLEDKIASIVGNGGA